MAGLTPEQTAFYTADLVQVNATIAVLQQSIAENQAAIQSAQNEIATAQQTIETDQANLNDPNLDPAAVQDIQNNIDEAQASIDQNQQNIQQATNTIGVDQNQLGEQLLYQERDQEALGSTTAPDTVTNTIDPQVPASNGTSVPISQTTATAPVGYTQSNQASTQSVTQAISQATGIPTNVINSFTSANPNATIGAIINQLGGALGLTAQEQAAIRQQATLNLAQQQQTIADQNRQVNNGDWRVKLSLAPQSNYLYNADDPGILAPLYNTGGVIFPYTPSIETSYRANYSNYDLTHSNYRGYFYQNSYTDAVSLRAAFTAQTTAEANYLLAVIHFFRSVTKMFYGQDTQRGSPPPLVYINGLGEYQFSQHPCLVSSFTYSLPSDVDYIRANSPTNLGLNQVDQRARYAVATTTTFDGNNRLAAAGLPPGAEFTTPQPPTFQNNTPTYVPTKMEIALSLLPVQSRQNISQNFSLRDFSTGQLLNGGYW